MQFQNRFYTNREMYKEYVTKILCRKVIAGGVLLAALAVVLCLMGMLWDNNVFLGIGVIFLFTAIVITLLTPKLTLDKIFEASLSNCFAPTAKYTTGPSRVITKEITNQRMVLSKEAFFLRMLTTVAIINPACKSRIGKKIGNR